jgi:hypothetical protein
MVNHAAKAVFHYFKNELMRQSVTSEEFAAAMERALRGLEPISQTSADRSQPVIESDLGQLAQESGVGCELLFFPRLRSQLKQHLQQSPRVVHYRGLRACVKQIVGTRRWTARCRDLQDQIVGFMRQCAGAEERRPDVALVVE